MHQSNLCCSNRCARTNPLATTISAYLQRQTQLAAATGLALTLATPGLIQAGTFTVTNTNDANAGSLRQAVLDANATPGADEIRFAAGVNGTIVLTSGTLGIDETITIIGPGATALSVDGSGASDILTVNDSPQDNPASVVLAISGLTLRNGRTALNAGVIFTSTRLLITDSVITGNVGAGIVMDAYFGGIELEARNCTISENGGRGINLSGSHFGRSVRAIIDNSTISGNGGEGLNAFKASIQLTESTISENANGIAIDGYWDYDTTSLDIADSLISGNSGYGLDLYSTDLQMDRTIVADNLDAGVRGRHFCSLQIDSSVVSGNGHGGVFMDVISGFESSFDIVNSSISGNKNGFGVTGGDWGGSIRHTTITENTGGGVLGTYNDIELKNSIIAGNGVSPDLDLSGGNPFTVQYSLIRQLGDTPITETVPGSNIIGQDPLLGALQDNGGPTPTHALLPDSPARDHGDPQFASPPDFDQRGEPYARVGHGRLDMGAYEVQDAVVAAVGTWRPTDRRFRLDSNRNGNWDNTAGGDTLTVAFGLATDVPVIGDWNGDGADDVGFRRPATSRFYLDANGNRQWDDIGGGDITSATFGLSTDRAVIGDWNGDGTDDIGVWRPSTRQFILDTNGNRRLDSSANGDIRTTAFGLATDYPVIGDWNGDGIDDLGFWRPSNRQFYLDANGNRSWDGTVGGDLVTGAFGLATDRPVVSDWNGDGTDDLGFWRPSSREFLLDTNRNKRWDGTAGGDTVTTAFGLSTDVPLVGSW